MKLEELIKEVEKFKKDIKYYNNRIYCKIKYKRFLVSKSTMYYIVRNLESKLQGIKQAVETLYPIISMITIEEEEGLKKLKKLLGVKNS